MNKSVNKTVKRSANRSNNRNNNTNKKVKKPSQANLYKAAMASKIKPRTAIQKKENRQTAKKNAKEAEETRKAHIKKAYSKKGTIEARHPMIEMAENPHSFGYYPDSD